MIKGKDGKWYPTKAKMLEAETKIEPNTKEQITEKEPDNSKPFQKRLQQINSIFKLKEQQKNEDEIASKVGVAKSYVEDVLRKGYEETETELRQQYHIPEDPIVTPQEESEIPEDPKPKKEKKIKEPKEKKESLRQIIERLAPAEPFTSAEMVKIVQEAYPDLYKDTSVKLHLVGLDATNEKSAKNFPSLFKHAFLECIGKGKEKQYQRKN